MLLTSKHVRCFDRCGIIAMSAVCACNGESQRLRPAHLTSVDRLVSRFASLKSIRHAQSNFSAPSGCIARWTWQGHVLDGSLAPLHKQSFILDAVAI